MSGARPKFSAFLAREEPQVQQTVVFGFADVSPDRDVVMKPSKSAKKETKSRSPVKKASKSVAKSRGESPMKGVSPVKKSAKKP